MTGDVTVPSGKTLTIAAGTIVTSGNSAANANNALIVEGTLIITNDTGQNVVFQPFEGTTWKGIQIRATGNAQLYKVIISGAKRGLAIASGTATLTNCIFENNETGLHVFDTTPQSYGDENPKVTATSTSFLNNTLYGIKEDGTARPQMWECSFSGNTMDYYSAEDTELTTDELNSINKKL
jgi:hypothetical protein